MKVVILAAGRGKRMGEWTEEKTKAMLPIPDSKGERKPMLQITIENFVNCGFNEFVIVVGYRKQDIIEHFGDGKKFGASIQYVTQKDVCAGTADAVKCANYYLEGYENTKDDTPFFLVYGDVVPTFNDISNIFLKGFETAIHSSIHSDMCGVMAVRTVNDPERYGVVEVNKDNVIRIVEKSPNPPTNLVNAGIYILPLKIFQFIRKTQKSPRGEYELTDSLQMLIDSGVVVKFEMVEGVRDIGTKVIYEESK